MIVSRQRILDVYDDIYSRHSNDAERYEAVAKKLGIAVGDVVKTIHKIETEH